MGALTQTPKNAIGLKDDVITLKCSSDGPYGTLQWSRDGTPMVSEECLPLDPRYSTTHNSTNNDCFLLVHANYTSQVSGSYICFEYPFPFPRDNAEVFVIIIGQ